MSKREYPFSSDEGSEINTSNFDDEYKSSDEEKSEGSASPSKDDKGSDDEDWNALAGEEPENFEATADGGDIPITPFNMKEELEEGHFDADGTYVWKKQQEIKDNWLENIDWVKIKKGESETADKMDEGSDSDDSDSFDHIEVYKKMLEYMKPRDTVAKTIRRLGGNKTLSTAEKWKRKKLGTLDNDSEERQKVTEFTGLADSILTKTGNMDVYQETFENISVKVNNAYKVRNPPKESKPPELDMYADDFDVKEKAKLDFTGPKRDTEISINKTTIPSSKEPELDMYADDFDEKEKMKIQSSGAEINVEGNTIVKPSSKEPELDMYADEFADKEKAKLETSTNKQDKSVI